MKKKNNAYNPDGYEMQLGTDHHFCFIPELHYTTYYEEDEVGNTRICHESSKTVKKGKKGKKK